MVDAPLEWFGRYVLLEPLGQGGMGRIDLALKKEAGVERLVVLKRLRAGHAASPESAAALRQEAKLAARLAHPNVVKTLGTEETGTQLAIVMDYVEGHALVELMRAHQGRGSRVPVAIALRILSDALLGLEWAHSLRGEDGRSLNLVHSDVTPHNLLITYSGKAQLLDFGLASITAAVGGTASIGRGKLGYMSPEQIRGEELDRCTDVFAMGVILWELLVGRRLLHGPNATRDYISRAWEPLPSVRSAASLDARLAAIVDRALAHSRTDRFATASELRLAIDAYAATSEYQASQYDVVRHLKTILGGAHDARRERILERYVFVHKMLREDRSETSAPASPSGSRSDAPVVVVPPSTDRRTASHLLTWPLALAAGVCAVGLGLAASSPGMAALASSVTSRAHREKRVVERRLDSLRVPIDTTEKNVRTDARERASETRETRLRGDDGG